MNRFARSPRRFSGRRAAAGATLIEVLVAVLILAIGLLGLAALQARSLLGLRDSWQRSTAVVQTYAILDALRSQPTLVGSDGLDLSMTCQAAAAPVGDLRDWVQALHDQVDASACGRIACRRDSGSTDADCTVTVQWHDPTAPADAPPRQLVTETVL